MKSKLSLFLFVLLAFCNPGFSQGNSLNETALEILKKSPGYKSDTYSLESAFSSLKTESNLPDPEIGGEYLVMPKDVDNRWTTELSWSVEWPGVYGARSKAAKENMSVAEMTIYAQRIEKLAEIKDLLLDYIQCRQKLVLLEELNNNNDTIFLLAEQASKGGEMTILDLNKVKLEYSNIKGARIAVEDEEASVKASLSQIYGKDCSRLLENLSPVFPEIILPTEEEILQIKEFAPTVQIANAEAEAARKARNVSRMEALPSLSLGYKHQYEDGMHFNGVTWGVSLPIFSSRGKQKAAKAEIMDAEFKAEAAAMEIETEAYQTWKRLCRLNEQIKELIPLVEDSNYNDALIRAYKGGELTLIEYISDRNYFTNAAVELVGMRLAAAKAQSQLQKLLSPL